MQATKNAKPAAPAPWKKPISTGKETGKRQRDEKPSKPFSKPSVPGGAKPAFAKKPDFKPSNGPRKPAGDFKKPKAGKKITKDDQERLRTERKASHPQSDIIDKLVRQWNELRERQTTAERKHQLVGDMLKQMKGRIMEVALRHDTSRAVQGCLKHGTAEQKETVCKELYGQMLYLCKSKHGHQHVQKMLKYGSQETRRAIAKELSGNVARLMTHALGALVIETGFTEAWSPATCWGLFQEMYGPEYVHFKADADVAPRNLTGILTRHPSHRKRILESVFFTLSRAIDKNLLSLSVIQRLLCEYLCEAPPHQVVAMVGAVKDQLLSLVSSREGAKAAVLCFAYGTAKERKLMLRALKGHMLDVACHLHGCMVLVAALQYTDDTKTSYSAIFSELQPHLSYLACHRHGKNVLLSLLAPKNSRYFSAYQLDLLLPVSLPAYLVKRKDKAGEGEGEGAEGKEGSKDAAPAAAVAAAGGETEAAKGAAPPPAAPRVLPEGPTAEQAADSAPTATSKKEDGLRRAELLVQLRSHLETACVTRTSLLARSKHGVTVLLAAGQGLGNAPAPGAAKGGKQQGAGGALLASLGPNTAILASVAELLVSEPSAEELAEQVSEMEKAAAQASAGASEKQSGVQMKEAGPVAPTAGTAAPAAAPSSKRLKLSSEEDEAMEGQGLQAMGRGAMSGHVELEEEEEADGGDEGMDEDTVADEEDEDDAAVLPRDGAAGGEEDDAGADVHEAAAYAEGEDMLPILEHAPSHLLFKRLLAAEAVPRAAGAGHANDKSAAVAATGTSTAAPVFGPLLLDKIKGEIADLVDSNRAAFVIVELLNSRDGSVSTAVRKELSTPAALLALTGGPAKDTAGVKVLLKLLHGAAPGASQAPSAAPAASASKAGQPGKASSAPTPTAAPGSSKGKASPAVPPAPASASAGRDGGKKGLPGKSTPASAGKA